MKSREFSRREFGKVAAGALLPVTGMTGIRLSVSTRQERSAQQSFFKFQVEPGCVYELTLEAEDEYPVGTRWGEVIGTHLGTGSADRADPASGPLWSMYRQRVVWKLDDLADWSFPSWRRFCSAVEKAGGKASLGINPGRCSAEVFDWLRSLDDSRFELWNHTWDHGAEGPRQTGLAYARQYENLDICQQKVRDELGLTMRAFGPAGIRPFEGADYWISDGDEVTYYAVRNHPDLVAYFGAGEFGDRGKGQINSEGVLTVGGPINLEYPDGLNTEPETRDLNKRHLVEAVKALYPEENPSRPPGPGNPEELVWRMEHPYDLKRPEEIEAMAVIFLQCHPWNWDFGAGLQSAATLASHINRSPKWRFSSAYEAYRWLKDKDRIELEKTGQKSYTLNARSLEFSHTLEFDALAAVRVSRAPYIGSKIGED